MHFIECWLTKKAQVIEKKPYHIFAARQARGGGHEHETNGSNHGAGLFWPWALHRSALVRSQLSIALSSRSVDLSSSGRVPLSVR